MSQDTRTILEEIAADIIAMKRTGTPYAEILDEARTLSDSELINFITA